VALERQTIEKKDFPLGRRGYDPDAVDAHLARIAQEVEELKSASRRRGETLAFSAAEQVRAIVEAAETSAGEIQRQAEEEAREIRAEASREAESARQEASDQAREYLGKVSESTSGMLQRLDAMQSELSALIESLRTGGNRLNADLQLLEGGLEEIRGALAPRPSFEGEQQLADSEPAQYAEPEPATDVDTAATGDGEVLTDELPITDAAAPEAAVPLDEELELEQEPEPGVTDAEDTEGARLIALNMALNGTPREETDQYLAENFDLRDRDALLDEVYASVES
jgi:DivIVA domain-containing protein